MIPKKKKEFLPVVDKSSELENVVHYGILTGEFDSATSQMKNIAVTSEIRLTSTLWKVLDEKGMTDVFADVESFDVGITSAYAETFAKFVNI